MHVDKALANRKGGTSMLEYGIKSNNCALCICYTESGVAARTLKNRRTFIPYRHKT